MFNGVPLARWIQLAPMWPWKSLCVAGPGSQQWVKCPYRVSLTSGTILHQTKIPLTHWFWGGISDDHRQARSFSALDHQPGLTCYATTWTTQPKHFRAMVNATREPPLGEVEVDDTWICGEQTELQGSRQVKDGRAALVMVAVEKLGRACDRT